MEATVGSSLYHVRDCDVLYFTHSLCHILSSLRSGIVMSDQTVKIKKRLQKSLPSNLFQNISIAVFSLGDRCYGPDKFCAAGRKLIIRLRQLGATLLVDPGYGDDNTPNGGIFVDLDQWLYSTLLPHLFPSRAAINDGKNIMELEFIGMDKRIQTNISNQDEFQKHPLYNITIITDDIVNSEAKSTRIEEWRKEQYRTAYVDFFERQSPPNAYRYTMQQQNYNFDHKRHGTSEISRRPQGSKNDTHTQNKGEDGNDSSMLFGRVVENRRLTAPNWEQNTRHIRLDVSTSRESLCIGEVNSDATTRSSCSKNPSELVKDILEWNLDNLPYRAGDVAAVMPSNTTQEVNKFLSVLPKYLQQLADCDLLIQCSNKDSSFIFSGVGYRYWPTRCTLRGFLTYCADIHALPEREDLRALAQYCAHHLNGKQQHDKLVSLSETKDSALFVDYIIREKRSWADVLYDFDSLRDDVSNLTVEAILDLLLPIRPRLFSIASSPTKDWMDRNEKPLEREVFGVELCVGTVEGTTRRGRKFHGLCSNYLCGLTSTNDLFPTYTVRLWIQPGSFHGLPLQVRSASSTNIDESIDLSLRNTPVLFIGAGTGVAPLRAMIQERHSLRQLNSFKVTSSTSNPNYRPTENTLLFGCRKKYADFYYADEWTMLENLGQLQVLTAFSQDQRNKVYVQEVLSSENFGHEKIVRHLIDNNGAIYIAGGPKMARAVNDVIIEALCQFATCSDEKRARKTLSKIQTLGLYNVEAWS